MKYFQKRMFDEMQRNFDKVSGAIEAKSIKQLQRAYMEIKWKLLGLYKAIDYDKPASLYGYAHYYEVMNQIREELRQAGQQNIDTIEEGLVRCYDDTSSIIYHEVGFKPMPHMRETKEIVNSLWAQDGKLFSDRVWAEMDALYQHLEQGLIDCVSLGKSSKELASEIAKEFNVSGYQAKRLCRTEMAHVMTQASMDRYREAGINQVLFISADSQSCEACDILDGNVYDLDNAPLIPIHPQCRCCLAPVVK